MKKISRILFLFVMLMIFIMQPAGKFLPFVKFQPSYVLILSVRKTSASITKSFFISVTSTFW